MVQSKEEHRKVNREQMAQKRAAIRKAAKQGDPEALKVIESERKYHQQYSREHYQSLKAKADNGDQEAQNKLETKKHNDYINASYLHIRNADNELLDKLEDLIDKRINELTEEAK